MTAQQREAFVCPWQVHFKAELSAELIFLTHYRFLHTHRTNQFSRPVCGVANSDPLVPILGQQKRRKIL